VGARFCRYKRSPKKSLKHNAVTINNYYNNKQYSPNRTKSPKLSTLHIPCSQQVSDQLNISSACTAYLCHVSPFIAFCVFILFPLFCLFGYYCTQQLYNKSTTNRISGVWFFLHTLVHEFQSGSRKRRRRNCIFV